MQIQRANGIVHSVSSPNSESTLEELRESALEHLLSLRVFRDDGTALFRASDGSDNLQYRNAWFRDNIHVIRGLMAIGYFSLVDKIWSGLFETLRKYENVMDNIISDPSSYSNNNCLPPRVVPETLERVPGDWTDTQEPQWLGELLSESAAWISGLRDETKANTYRRLYSKSAEYLIAIGCFDGLFSNAWEEEPLDVYTSNIAASLTGLKTAKQSGVFVPNHIIEYGEKKLEERLNPLCESSTRNLDLSLFWLVNVYNVVSKDMGDKIVSQLINGLGTQDVIQLDLGRPRYDGDVYPGLDDPDHNSLPPHSVPEGLWTMYWTSLARYYASRQQQEPYANALETAINLRVDGKSVEQYVLNSKGIYEPRNPLAWADAQLLEALK
ncbi:MAG: hypothetical protein IH934_06795 [Nanoarchaeota archaeon]|nr:hypothetical protein [Nanoarchaeota archaeon]